MSDAVDEKVQTKFKVTPEFLEEANQNYMNAFLDLLNEVEVVEKEEKNGVIEIFIQNDELPDVERLKVCFHSEGSGVNALFRVPEEAEKFEETNTN